MTNLHANYKVKFYTPIYQRLPQHIFSFKTFEDYICLSKTT